AVLSAGALVAQDQTSYRKPPDPVARVLEAEDPPHVTLDPTGTTLLHAYRESMPSIATLARPILRIAGRRLDPATRGPQRGRSPAPILDPAAPRPGRPRHRGPGSASRPPRPDRPDAPPRLPREHAVDRDAGPSDPAHRRPAPRPRHARAAARPPHDRLRAAAG